MRALTNDPCPCGSEKKFKRCCLPVHKGESVPDPEELVRSRYSAFVSGDYRYIIASTHPAAPQHTTDQQIWIQEIRKFSELTSFDGLECLGVEMEEDEMQCYVSFRVKLTREGEDVSFGERSLMRRFQDRWMYLSGADL
ncbi:MAG: SEC-C motif-containing protein [Planctomycetota bacterium]|jgi:SEC-C motif-containing protein